jgi:hypothetical protein
MRLEQAGRYRALGRRPLRALLGLRPRLERGEVSSGVDLKHAPAADRPRDSNNSLSISIASQAGSRVSSHRDH